MSEETTNTTGFDLKPEARYVLEIEKVTKKSIGKEGGKQYPGYEWHFEIKECDQELDDNNLKLFMFKSQMGDLLRALGAKEVNPDIFEWNTEDVVGKMIECHLAHIDISGTKRESLIEIKKFEHKVDQQNSSENPPAWDE